MYLFTAAHKTLPLPCFARVTNLDNGRSIIVRINDRGPFHEDRIIDLSYAAAVKLGINATGTGLVEVRAIDPGKPEPKLPETLQASTARAPGREASAGRAAVESPARKATLYVQAGAFSDRDNAKKLEAKLENEGVRDVFLDTIDRGGPRAAPRAHRPARGCGCGRPDHRAAARARHHERRGQRRLKAPPFIMFDCCPRPSHATR
jgi:rare lipoprotein A